MLLFHVGPPPDEGEDDHGVEESKAAKRKVLSRKHTKGNYFLRGI